MRRLGALLTIIVLAGCGFLLTTTTAHADDTVGIAIAPVNTKGQTDGRSRFSYKVDPGQTVTDHVRVSNAGTTPLKVTVFAADAYNESNGEFALRTGDEATTGAASWVEFAGKKKLQLTLARGEAKTIAFTVTIPKDATPGDHPAGILASATTVGQVTVERRIADRMYVRVSGDLQPILTITSFSGTYHSGLNPLDGSITVNATITNSGNVALEGVATLSTNTWFGLGVGQTARQDLPEILPGNTSTVTFQLSGVPPVGYAIVKMLLQGGISGDAPDPGPLPVIQRDAFLLAIPWIVLTVILLGGGGWFFLSWRRRREDTEAREWMAQTEAEALRRVQTLNQDAPSAATGTGEDHSPLDVS
jgi:dihydroorotate dehydrogenase (fumarate)